MKLAKRVLTAEKRELNFNYRLSFELKEKNYKTVLTLNYSMFNVGLTTISKNRTF